MLAHKTNTPQDNMDTQLHMQLFNMLMPSQTQTW